MLKEIIYETIKKKESDYQYNDIHFSPYSITDCGRKIYYKLTNTEKSNPTDEHTQLKFALGDITHIFIQNMLKKSQKVKVLSTEGNEGENRKINFKGLDFLYRPDIIVEINGVKYVVEIKSTYFSGWKTVELEPKIENKVQLYFYMKFENIENGIIFYIGRDNGHIIEYPFNLENINIDEKKHIDDLILIKHSVENRLLPERKYKIYMKKLNGEIKTDFMYKGRVYKSDFQCTYCYWRSFCWKNEIETIMQSENNFYIDGKYF